MSQHPRTLDPNASPGAFFGAELRALRERERLSQARLGRLVHASGDLIAKVEKAERRPLPDLVERLDRALDANGHLIKLAERMPNTRTQPHRRFGQTADAAAGEMADALREILDGIRQLDHGLGSGRALPALLAHARLVESLLPGFSGAAQLAVLNTLGEAHQLAGWLQFDNGQLSSAEASFVTAGDHGERSGNPALVAYALGPSHGFARTYAGDPRGGAARCDEALVHALQSGNRRLIAFVLAVGARAYAKLGERGTCLAMLDRAEHELARHDPDSVDPMWLTVFDEGALHGHRGSCWLDLGETCPRRAVPCCSGGDRVEDVCSEPGHLAPRSSARAHVSRRDHGGSRGGESRARRRGRNVLPPDYRSPAGRRSRPEELGDGAGGDGAARTPRPRVGRVTRSAIGVSG